jgi:hypothetical protein
LALIHKVIAFYLENRADVDRYVADCRAALDEQRIKGRHPDWQALRQRFEALHQSRLQQQ